jgi:ABC-2 type transport system permease protein
METIIPKNSTVLKALFRADITTIWRNRRAAMVAIIIPVIILLTSGKTIEIYGGAYVLSNSLCYGLIAIGLMGYSNSLARDRDKGIFQRLRVAPVPTWAIMISRLMVQLVMILIVTSVLYIVGYKYQNIKLTAAGYALNYITAIISASVYLALGQVIVALTKNSETVNAVSRLVFLCFVVIGTFASIPNFLPDQIAEIMRWSPYGTVKILMAAGMVPGAWNMDATYSLLITLVYISVFATIGIRKFKWDTK